MRISVALFTFHRPAPSGHSWETDRRTGSVSVTVTVAARRFCPGRNTDSCRWRRRCRPDRTVSAAECRSLVTCARGPGPARPVHDKRTGAAAWPVSARKWGSKRTLGAELTVAVRGAARAGCPRPPDVQEGLCVWYRAQVASVR